MTSDLLNLVIHEVYGEPPAHPIKMHTIGGGCINHTACFEFLGDKHFLKWNNGNHSLYEKEATGLNTLRATHTIRIPEVRGFGKIDNTSYLCLEYIETGVVTSDFWTALGCGLADLHHMSSENFGLEYDNFIGELHQPNRTHDRWVEFFIHERLLPQLRLGLTKRNFSKELIDRFEKLFEKLPGLIPEESPALLHGDLWSGNFMVGYGNEPFIFDPAIYYGHREAEMAFTKLFGGFDPVFYETYQETFPLIQGHEERVDLFNLYPLLVHVNLFGTSYLSGILHTLKRFI